MIAAGNADSIALLSAERHGSVFQDWLLVAPTWRGPFPTMARRQSRAFPLIHGQVESPLLGPLLNACLERISEVTDDLKKRMAEFEKELAGAARPRRWPLGQGG